MTWVSVSLLENPEKVNWLITCHQRGEELFTWTRKPLRLTYRTGPSIMGNKDCLWNKLIQNRFLRSYKCSGVVNITLISYQWQNPGLETILWSKPAYHPFTGGGLVPIITKEYYLEHVLHIFKSVSTFLVFSFPLTLPLVNIFPFCKTNSS